MLKGCPDLCLNDVPAEDREGVVTQISLLHHLLGQPANKHTQINLLDRKHQPCCQRVSGGGGGYLDVDSHSEGGLANEEGYEEGEECGEEGRAGDEGATAGQEGEGEGGEAQQEGGEAEGREAGCGGEVVQHQQPQSHQGDEEPRDEDQEVDGADGGPQQFITTILTHPD